MKLQEKIGRRTVIRRLADKGYTAQKKLSKSDPAEAQKKKRVLFAEKHKSKDKLRWQSYLQAVADLKARPSKIDCAFPEELYAPLVLYDGFHLASVPLHTHLPSGMFTAGV